MEKEIIGNVTQKMQQTLAALINDFAKVNAGRATPKMLDNILVEYYGSTLPINQLANITVPEPQTLVIVAWDKGAVKSIEKSIIKANIGITPQNDGTVIRLPIPPLTKERRLDLVKQIKKIAEDYKTSIRNSRREGNTKVKDYLKNKDISENEAKAIETKIQKITDEYIAKVDAEIIDKEKELLNF